MPTRLRDLFHHALDEMRYERLTKRIRAELDGVTVIDTTEALLLWEPRRWVPAYAVPAAAIRAEIVEGAAQTGDEEPETGLRLPDVSDRPVLAPSVSFMVHSTPGRALTIGGRVGAGFALDDPELGGYVVLDFDAFDAWFEENRRNVGHPRDTYHRIDVLPSSRSVRVEHDGVLLAESDRPTIVFEAMLPPRFYLPRADVRVELEPGTTRSTCAYKGHAVYWTAAGVPDVAWSYPEPLEEMTPLRDLVCFFDERVDMTVDGVTRSRPTTFWS